jgi:SAM-dependent methyltransferase
MNSPIIETPLNETEAAQSKAKAWARWLSSPMGNYLKRWEQAALDAAVADIFGYHAVQLDNPELDGLSANRMPHRWHVQALVPVAGHLPDNAATPIPIDLVADGSALPFEAASLDLVVMPHTLELCLDPHATLREVERVLVPEGQVVITGINPVSWWGWHQRRSALYRSLGWRGEHTGVVGHLIAYWRMRDWLRLLGFEVQVSRFGCWRPAFQSTTWLARFAWLDRWGPRWWPILGGSYLLVAVKRVPGGRMLGRAWKRSPAKVGHAMPVAHRQHAVQPETDKMAPSAGKN